MSTKLRSGPMPSHCHNWNLRKLCIHAHILYCDGWGGNGEFAAFICSQGALDGVFACVFVFLRKLLTFLNGNGTVN